MTKIEKLYQAIKKSSWEYGVSRYVDQDKMKVYQCLGGVDSSSMTCYIINNDLRDRYSLRYTCPVKNELKDNGKLINKKAIYEQGKWEIITRKEFEEKKRGIIRGNC